MYKLFILSGASGAGKSTLLDQLVANGYCNPVTKYTDRKKFNTVDDVTSVTDLNILKLKCDIRYSMYGNAYGFNSSQLKMNLTKHNQILITNDKHTINKLKCLFAGQIVVIYVFSDINTRLLQQIYMKRHGFPSMLPIQSKVLLQLETGKLKLLDDNSEGFVESIEEINKLIDSILLDDDEFKMRANSIKHQEQLYSSKLFSYDYVVLNMYSSSMSTIHATKSAFEQLKKIIKKETES